MNKPKIVWLSAITCNGNTHSFLAASSIRLELFLSQFDLLHPSLNLDYSIEQILSLQSIDFLVIEGSITKNKAIHSIDGKTSYNTLKKLSKISKYIICAGSCSSFGGIHKQINPDEVFSVSESLGKHFKSPLSNHLVINLSGCPAHPEWILQTIFSLQKNKKIDLDNLNRPVALYSSLAHHGCNRNEYFEWKVEAKGFGHKEGCLFYNEGCQGPMTHSSCNTILWNEISSKTKVGMPCIGCTEPDFPKNNLFSTKKFMGIPAILPVGISTRGYLSMAGVAKTFKIDRLHKKLIDENS